MDKIRMIGRYGTFRVGDIIAAPASLRKLLIDRRLAETVEDLTELVEPEIWLRRPAKKRSRKRK